MKGAQTSETGAAAVEAVVELYDDDVLVFVSGFAGLDAEVKAVMVRGCSGLKYEGQIGVDVRGGGGLLDAADDGAGGGGCESEFGAFESIEGLHALRAVVRGWRLMLRCRLLLGVGSYVWSRSKLLRAGLSYLTHPPVDLLVDLSAAAGKMKGQIHETKGQIQ